MAGSPTRLLTVDEAANRLTLKPKTMRVWIAARRIEVVRIGRAVRIPETEITRVLDAGRIPALRVS